MPTVSAPRSERSVIAFLAFIGVLMAYGIDAVLPAFDDLRLEFGLDARGLSPAITGTPYFVGAAIGQLVYGVFADRFGRRAVLMTGIAVYIVGALASALSPSLGLLLAARFVWGCGAAAPSVLRFTIARDLYEGDRMARVVSTFSAIFLLGPIFVPVLGQGVLVVGSWRTIFAVGILLAAFALVWTMRFGETMDPANRRPIRLAPLRAAFASVLATPITRWLVLALGFFNAAFFIWLGSAQPVIDEIYHRGDWFTLYFGLSGAGMAVALLVNNRLIDRFGVRRMVVVAAATFVVVTTVCLGLTLGAGGVPSFGVWFGWALVTNALSMIMGPMSVSLALEPMADKAGTASAVIGVVQFGAGALLAAMVDARIDGTVTPMVVGALVFGLAGLGLLLLGLTSSGPHGEPERVVMSPAAIELSHPG